MKFFNLIMCMKVIEKILRKIYKFQNKKLMSIFKSKKKLNKRKNKEFMVEWKKKLFWNNKMKQKM